MLPEAFVLARVEVRGTEKACGMSTVSQSVGWLMNTHACEGQIGDNGERRVC